MHHARSFVLAALCAISITGLASRGAAALDCSAPRAILDFGVVTSQTVIGDTRGGADLADTYSCGGGLQDGAEEVVELVMPQAGRVFALQTAGAPGLRLFVLDACGELTCVAEGAGRSCAADLPPGTHYLVVDSAAGAEGPYDVLVGYEPPFDRWSSCQDPVAPTQLGDTASDAWHFDDGAPCYSDPASRNFPNGCTFAMYVAPGCGTEIHFPLFDAESPHVRVFDLLRGECVVLSALSTAGWSMSGCDIAHEDCNESDPRFDDVAVDISFSNPDGVCGIYRLEFPLHSGSAWDLYSNCTGGLQPGFTIHDSLCGALDAYAPLPNVSIMSASAVYDCPDVTVTYELRNDGCQTAENFQLNLIDGGQLVATEVVDVPVGETVSGSFTATLPPTWEFQLHADRFNVTPECDEAPGLGCGGGGGAERVVLPGCPNTCQVVAEATVTPGRICPGQSVTIEAGSSTASLCPSALEYELTGPGQPGGFQSSSTFTDVSPTVTSSYEVAVRCTGNPFCSNTVPVTVNVDQPQPDLLPRVGTSLRLGGGNGGASPTYDATSVLLSWSSVPALDVPAGEHFHVLRSEAADSGFTLLAGDAPTLTTATVFDLAAPHPGAVPHLFYYLVLTADACENDNRNFDLLP